MRGIVAFFVLACVAFLAFFLAHEDRLTWFDPKPVLAAAAKYDATILRDRYGVPHVRGRRDADAAFGLAYAHAEDDFATLQRALLAARGRLATLDGVSATENDYLVQLLGIWDAIAAHYETDLSAETRALLDGYATGFNLYAAQHRGQVMPGFEPARGEDLAALFMLRLPFFYGLDNQLRALIAGGSTKFTGDLSRQRAVAIALAPTRSADGATRLLINPQGPLGGRSSWYEASVASEEGWNLSGGTMPGSPVLMSGASPDSGWGISPNRPDLIDIYTLESNPNDRYFYRFDDEWRRLESREARIVARVWGPIRLTFRREVLRSVHGPVIRNRNGLFAVRYAGQDDVRGVEAFFRLNKAKTLDAFMTSLEQGGIPSLEFVYADKGGRIAFVYNAAFPARPQGYDWTRPVPGNVSDSLWQGYLPFGDTPKVIAPPGGFVIAANATPFATTSDPFNPKPESFAAGTAIETGLSNRARRAMALFSADRAITSDELRSYKFDSCYAPNSDFATLIKEIAQRNYAGDPLLEEAGELLRRYNLCTEKSSRGAALAVLTAAPLLQAAAEGRPRPDPAGTLRATANRLLSQFGRLDPTWGSVNRLRRGALDLALSGGPDTLRDVAIEPRLRDDGTSTAQAGDSLVLVSTWLRDGSWQLESLVPFGSSQVPGSRHYADQAQLFADGKLKQVPVNPADVMAEATQIERPGKPPPPKGRAPVLQAPLPEVPALTVSRPANAAEQGSRRSASDP
jgi:penicillin amidase/acyl-homoserine-lactone acylase